MMPLHFLRFFDLGPDRVYALLEQAEVFAQHFKSRSMSQHLRGKRVALSFEDSGFRNRAAFEVGIRLMGGDAIHVSGRPGVNEPAADFARYLSNWFDAIVIRTPEYSIIEEIAAAASVPVVNARTRHNHPCEILGDLAFVRKTRGSIEGLRVVFVGESTNLCHSWFEAGACLPIDVVQVCPPGYEIDRAYLTQLKSNAAGNLRTSYELEAALRTADVIYTDCWPTRGSLQEHEAVARVFTPLRITGTLLEKAPAACVFLPCPPVTRGEEVTDDAMRSYKCRVYEAKSYLLHAQNALLNLLLT